MNPYCRDYACLNLLRFVQNVDFWPVPLMGFFSCLNYTLYMLYSRHCLSRFPLFYMDSSTTVYSALPKVTNISVNSTQYHQASIKLCVQRLRTRNRDVHSTGPASSYTFYSWFQTFRTHHIPCSRGWVDPVPDPLLFRKSRSTENRTRDL
jgi:hypothetical protein